MGGQGIKAQTGREEPTEARRAHRARDLGWERRWRVGASGCKAGRRGRGRSGQDAGTCFRGSCTDNSVCWVAARVSAPPQSHPPRCSPAPYHPHPATPAKTGASPQPPRGPVSPSNRSPAAGRSSVSRLDLLPVLAHLSSACFLSPGQESPFGEPALIRWALLLMFLNYFFLTDFPPPIDVSRRPMC